MVYNVWVCKSVTWKTYFCTYRCNPSVLDFYIMNQDYSHQFKYDSVEIVLVDIFHRSIYSHVRIFSFLVLINRCHGYFHSRIFHNLIKNLSHSSLWIKHAMFVFRMFVCACVWVCKGKKENLRRISSEYELNVTNQNPKQNISLAIHWCFYFDTSIFERKIFVLM